MMSTSDIASKLRRGLNSKVLGGLALDDFINEDELKASERSAHTSWAETPRMWVSPDNDKKQTLFVILDEPGSGKIATLLSAFIQVGGILLPVNDSPRALADAGALCGRR